jgi:hypothetical protein
METSGWAPKYFPESLKREIKGRLQDKVMFGSDYPVLMHERLFLGFEAEGYNAIAEEVGHTLPERHPLGPATATAPNPPADAEFLRLVDDRSTASGRAHTEAAGSPDAHTGQEDHPPQARNPIREWLPPLEVFDRQKRVVLLGGPDGVPRQLPREPLAPQTSSPSSRPSTRRRFAHACGARMNISIVKYRVLDFKIAKCRSLYFKIGK